MRSLRLAIAFFVGISLAGPALAQGNGNGRGNGGGGNGEPPAQFVPEIAYFDQSRKYKDIRLANRAGDQACVVLRVNDGAPNLRGFAFSAGTKQLAYSIDETGIFITNWTNNPCEVQSAQDITNQGFLVQALAPGDAVVEFMDFSPDGSRLVWGHAAPDYNSMTIVMHEVNAGTGTTTLPLVGWTIFGVRFSPDFASSNELIFIGKDNDGPTGTAFSLFGYDILSSVSGSNPRQIFNATTAGADLHAFVAVTNPQASGNHRIAVTDNVSAQIFQFDLSGNRLDNSFSGNEPAYSCNNSEIIHRRTSGRNYDNYITSADGSSSQKWSSDGLRWLDWLCP